MNPADNVERIESGHRDKTAGSSFREQRALSDAVRGQRAAFDLVDLAEELDMHMLTLAKQGRSLELGATLIKAMESTVLRRAEFEADLFVEVSE